MSYLLLQGDAVHLPFPDRAVDLVFGSPPYIDARTYGIKAQRACQEWIDWMLVVTEEACRVSRGLVLWVCASGVRNHCYQPAPEGLLYEWWRRGGQCWRPAYWYRSGIPGSGGQHWLRADVEYVLAFLGSDRRPRRGRPATHSQGDRDWGAGGYTGAISGGIVRFKKKQSIKPQSDDHGEPAPNDPNAFWTDNTAMGHPPRGTPIYARITCKSDGRITKDCETKAFPPVLANPGNLIETEPEDDEGVWTDNTAMGHEPKWIQGGGSTVRHDNGVRENRDPYKPPILVNPGNLIKTGSGFGSMGSTHAHDNEAPFPESLAEFFIKTACKPGGIVLDPFSGSGTTVAVAERLGRHGLGIDIRRCQAELAERRIIRPHSERKRTGRPEKDLPLFS